MIGLAPANTVKGLIAMYSEITPATAIAAVGRMEQHATSEVRQVLEHVTRQPPWTGYLLFSHLSF